MTAHMEAITFLLIKVVRVYSYVPYIQVTITILTCLNLLNNAFTAIDR